MMTTNVGIGNDGKLNVIHKYGTDTDINVSALVSIYNIPQYVLLFSYDIFSPCVLRYVD